MEWNENDNLEETLEDMIRQLIRMEKKFNSCENNKLEKIISWREKAISNDFHQKNENVSLFYGLAWCFNDFTKSFQGKLPRSRDHFH